MSFYSQKEYWNQRYQWTSDDEVVDDTFDWYVPYGIRVGEDATFAPNIGIRNEILAILPKMRSGAKLVIVGCGTSQMGEQLWDDGFRDILCVDFSEVCIKRMERRRALLCEGDTARENDSGRPPRLATGTVSREGLSYVAMECEELMAKVPRCSVDGILDKAMIDATMCDSDVDRQHERLSKMMEVFYEILKPGGSLIHVTSSKETGGPRGVIFRNAVAPWSAITAAKLELTSSLGLTDSEAAREASKPYWLFQLLK